MKIKQILNNNAVLVSKGSNELVVLASGIGFLHKIGQKIMNLRLKRFLYWKPTKW